MSMFGGGAMPSVADIAAVTRNNDGNGGWGDGNGWWVLIILFAIFGGWGNNGWGGNGGGCCQNAYETQAVVQRGFDTQAVISKLDGINSGICNLGYDQLAQMNGIGTTIMQTGFGLQQSINANNVANMQNTNALSTQLAQCCCENRAAVKDLQYQISQCCCDLNGNIHQTGDAILNSQNAGFNMLNQTIKDGFCNLQMQQKDEKIAELTAKLNNCDRDSALQGTASYIINSVRPTPIPSWNVQNPWAGCNCGNGCCGSFQNSCCA